MASRINEKYGTDFTYDDIVGSHCWSEADCNDGFNCPESVGPLCELAPDMQDAIKDGLYDDLPKIEIEMRCPGGLWVMRRSLTSRLFDVYIATVRWMSVVPTQIADAPAESSGPCPART